MSTKAITDLITLNDNVSIENLKNWIVVALSDVSIDDLARSEDFQTTIANVIMKSGVKKVSDEVDMYVSLVIEIGDDNEDYEYPIMVEAIVSGVAGDGKIIGKYGKNGFSNGVEISIQDIRLLTEYELETISENLLGGYKYGAKPSDGFIESINEDAQVCQSFLNDYILEEANRRFKINDY